jgi:hypothetical protein
VIDMIDLAANLDTGVGSGESRDPKLKLQLKICKPPSSPHEPRIFAKGCARRDLADDTPTLDSPMLFISLPALQALTIKDRFRLAAFSNRAPLP